MHIKIKSVTEHDGEEERGGREATWTVSYVKNTFQTNL